MTETNKDQGDGGVAAAPLGADAPNEGDGLGDFLRPISLADIAPEMSRKLNDFSKVRAANGVITFRLYRQGGSMTEMQIPDTIDNRRYVSWMQIHDGPHRSFFERQREAVAPAEANTHHPSEHQTQGER